MGNNERDTIIFAVSLILKGAVVAATYSGRARKRSPKLPATMDINEKDKEILFLIDTAKPRQSHLSLFRLDLT